MTQWDPTQYLRFARERTQPCIDLVGRIDLADVAYAFDLGCGPGNSTEVLRRKFPNAQIIGIDNSQQMIDRARAEVPGPRFVLGDVETWQADRPADIILANAVLQWTPGHDALFPQLVSQLRPGGMLAVQMPRNSQSPVHQILRELATSQTWQRELDSAEPYWVREPSFYYDTLAPHCAQLAIWETQYIHVMPDTASIVEWYKGTGLRPYLDRLTSERQKAFLDELLSHVAKRYSAQADGNVLFPFQRIFILATRRA